MASGYPNSKIPHQWEQPKQTVTTQIDPFKALNPFINSWTIGFAPLFAHLEGIRNANKTVTYPPYNIVEDKQGEYRVEIAVAGFAKDELEVTLLKNQLSVKGKRNVEEDDTITSIHRGIANRDFEQNFVVAEHVVVDKVKLDNGLLTITLHREIPEEDKPKKLKIS